MKKHDKGWLAGGFTLAMWLVAGISQAVTLQSDDSGRVIHDKTVESADYRLTLGELKKINSEWIAEREQRLQGNLHRQTWEYPADQDITRIFNFYRDQLLAQGGRELYYCESRRCGSSSAWATTRFDVRELYGLDAHQYYSAFEVIDSEEMRSFVAIYGVQRGNRRNYLQVDVMTTAEAPRISSSYGAISARLDAGESFTFVDAFKSDGGLDDEHLKSLVETLRRHRSWNIALVGHNFSRLSLSEQLAASEQLANRVRGQLIEAGVDDKRVAAHGVGALIPAARIGQRERVLQIVLIEE